MSRCAFDIFASVLTLHNRKYATWYNLKYVTWYNRKYATWYDHKYATLYYYRYHKYTLIKSQVLQTIIYHPSLTVMSSEEVITIEE